MLETIAGEEVGAEAIEPRRVTRLICLPGVKHHIGLARSTIYRRMAEGKFPKPFRLGEYSVAWADGRDVDW